MRPITKTEHDVIDLRKKLVATLDAFCEGRLPIEDALATIKVAHEATDSLRSEIEVAEEALRRGVSI